MEVVRERLGEVLPRVHRGVLRDERVLPRLGGAHGVVARQRLLVARALVAEQVAAARPGLVILDEDVLVVVPDLMAKVPENRPVRLAELDAHRLADVVEALRQVDRDDPVRVPDDDLASVRTAREQVEAQAARCRVPRHDRQSQVADLQEEAPLGLFDLRKLLERDRVVLLGSGAGEAARDAAAGRCVVADEPVAAPLALRAREPGPVLTRRAPIAERDEHAIDDLHPHLRAALGADERVEVNEAAAGRATRGGAHRITVPADVTRRHAIRARARPRATMRIRVSAESASARRGSQEVRR